MIIIPLSLSLFEVIITIMISQLSLHYILHISRLSNSPNYILQLSLSLSPNYHYHYHYIPIITIIIYPALGYDDPLLNNLNPIPGVIIVIITIIPIGSMYGIFTNIYPINDPNVGKYTIHGSYGIISQLSGNIQLSLSNNINNPILIITGDNWEVIIMIIPTITISSNKPSLYPIMFIK